MSERTVLPFRPRPVVAPIVRSDATAASVVWPVARLPDQRQCGEWLEHMIQDTAYENTARSLWRHHPNLKASTERLAGYITPMWPGADGCSLLQVAVVRAVSRAQAAIDEGQAFEGRLVGVYLYGLLDIVGDIAQLVVRGEDPQGTLHRWEYFSEPLLQWARLRGLPRVTVERVVPAPSPVVLSGLRTHMTARLADPIDAGYLARHASQG